MIATIRWTIAHCVINLLIFVVPEDDYGNELLNSLFRWKQRFEQTKDNAA